MKKANLILAAALSAAFLFPPHWGGSGWGFAQNIGINVTGNPANAKSLLDIDAATMSPKAGLLIPRLTTAERNAITAPIPEPLLIYNTTTQCFEAWNQATLTWVAMSCIGCQLPGAFSATAATNIAQTAFDANWTASAAATTYYLDVSTVSTFATFVTGYNNLNVGNVTTYSVNTNLTCATTYYYRVRANNSCGTSSNSNTITVTTAACVWACGSLFTDVRDGKSYNTVLIGSQCWMAENLNYGTYAAVTNPQASGTKFCQNLSGVNDATCPFGGLYAWANLMNGSASCNGTAPPPDANAKCATPVQGLCPAGWHIPSHYEWTLLEKNAGSNPGAFPYDVTTSGVYLGTDEGGNLKQTGTTNWTTPNTGATNSTGFTGLPGGYSWSGAFSNVGTRGRFWSSTDNGGSYSWMRSLANNSAQVYRDQWDKANGFSCRCVKD